MPAMRDVFLNSIYNDVLTRNDIYVLSADFGAIALDKYKLNCVGKYINTGISEQNTILTAAGLALSGKTVFVTAIAPFITKRCFEQIRLYPAGMNLPIVIVGVGAGIAYEDSGPTHHATEDISILRTLPNMEIYSPCDDNQIAYMAKNLVNTNGPAYVRLDRNAKCDIYKNDDTFEDGFSIIKPLREINIATTGVAIDNALKVYENMLANGVEIGIIDIYKIPFDIQKFNNCLKVSKKLITIEEHNLAGGLGSYICEIVADYEIDLKVKRFGFDFTKDFSHHYGGRDVVHNIYGFGAEQITSYIRNC